jgi:hypothetical protein
LGRGGEEGDICESLYVCRLALRKKRGKKKNCDAADMDNLGKYTGISSIWPYMPFMPMKNLSIPLFIPLYVDVCGLFPMNMRDMRNAAKKMGDARMRGGWRMRCDAMVVVFHTLKDVHSLSLMSSLWSSMHQTERRTETSNHSGGQ